MKEQTRAATIKKTWDLVAQKFSGRRRFVTAAPQGAQHGGAALEYILVTTFAAIVGVAALTFTGKAVKEQLSRLGQQLGMSEEPKIELPFSGTGGS